MHMMMWRKFASAQSGDTIIEVLLSIAILSVILTGAYVTADHSLLEERDAEEHSVALTIAQSQVEELVAGATLGSDTCLVNLTGSQNCSVESTDPGLGEVSSGVCQQSGAPFCYSVSDTPIHQPASTPNDVNWTSYEVDVTWYSLNGGLDSAQLYYRPQ
jgi:prepilin-type N-terminal cleavage/methylation domain-containing protein